ncbi:MAG: tetratricopeptide repeat protein [Planctomycetota bacterium]
MSIAETDFRRKEVPTWIGVVLLAFVTIATYGRVARQSFLSYDDDINVTANPLLNPVSFRGTVAFWLSSYAGMYAPVTYTFFAGEAWLAERPGTAGSLRHFDPLIFKLGNLTLHLACAFSVFFLLRSLNLSTGPAFFGAAFFSLHPLHAESVGWITETKGLLSGLFSILALWQYVEFTRAEGMRAKAIAGLATLLFVLAILSKPAAVTVPLLALLLDVGWLNTPAKKTAPLIALWFALAAAISMLAKRLQPDNLQGFVTPWLDRPWIVGDAITFYLSKLVIPMELAPDYGRSPAVALQTTSIRYVWLVPVAITVALCLFRQRRTLLASWGIFLAALLPVLGFVPFEFQDISTVADRYAYLAILGPSLILACGLSRVWRPWSIALSTTILFGLGFLSFQQVGHWRSDETIFAHALKVNPASVQALSGLGGIAYRQGRLADALELYSRVPRLNPTLAATHLSRVQNNLGLVYSSLGKPEEAIRHFEMSVNSNPTTADVHNNLGLVLESQGRFDLAIQSFQNAVRQNKDSSISHYNLARLLKRTGNESQAARHFRTAFQLQPDLFQARTQYGAYLAKQGKTKEAIRQFELALRLNPRFAEAHHYLAKTLGSLGRPQDAAAHFQAALEILPTYVEARTDLAQFLLANGNPDEALEQLRVVLNLQPGPGSQLLLARALETLRRMPEAVHYYRAAWIANPRDLATANHLAWILATNPDDKIRSGTESRMIAKQLCVNESNNAEYWATLAAAQAELKQFEDAKQTVQKALAITDEKANPTLVGRLRVYLASFEHQQPIRDEAHP